MIDIHSHILPGIDDGATNMSVALEMARRAVDDGTKFMACTPHFMPGMYDTTVGTLLSGIRQLQNELNARSIDLTLVAGGDIHASPDLVQKLDQGTVPSLGGTRYFLFEPPHHVLPPNLVNLCKQLLDRGYVPVLTHPERLTWIENHYDVVCALDELGVPVQLTAKSITGEFGKRPKYWSDRMLNEGRVDLIASDAHNVTSRPPGLSKARDEIERILGRQMAITIVYENPGLLLQNKPLTAKSPRLTDKTSREPGSGLWQSLKRKLQGRG
jgi:protein-tyrosine phosphatase